MMFRVTPLNNAVSFLTARQCYFFSPFEIIRRITCFSRFDLCFETQAGCIFSSLAYTILREIITLFFSNFSYHTFLMNSLLLPSNSYL